MYFWLDPIIVKWHRYSLLFFNEDWLFLLDVVRHSGRYLYSILFIHNLWPGYFHGYVDLLDDLVDEGYIVDFLFDLHHFYKEGPFNVINNFLWHLLFHRHILSPRNFYYFGYFFDSHHLLLDMDLTWLSLDNSFDWDYLFDYPILCDYLLFSLNQFNNFFMGLLYNLKFRDIDWISFGNNCMNLLFHEFLLNDWNCNRLLTLDDSLHDLIDHILNGL